MSKIENGECPSDASRGENGNAAFLSKVAGGLSLAATPVFAIMALVTATQHDGAADVMCAPGSGSSPLSGMTLMYALMSVFHAAPWIRFVSGRWS